jgi:hypothetical protein
MSLALTINVVSISANAARMIVFMIVIPLQL